LSRRYRSSGFPRYLTPIRVASFPLRDGVGDTQDPWQSAFENYTYTEKDGMTTLNVDSGPFPEDWADFMNNTWPKALVKLKAICEAK
jgi:hypothetical protein